MAWQWNYLGTPQGQTLGPLYITTAPSKNNPMAFVWDTGGRLWASLWDGQTWQWKDHGTPPGPDSLYEGEIAAASCQDTPRVFTITRDRQLTDEHLWINSWDGSDWNWTEQDTPSGTHFSLVGIAAISCQSTPYVFVWDDDNDPHLWVNWRPPPQ